MSDFSCLPNSIIQPKSAAKDKVRPDLSLRLTLAPRGGPDKRDFNGFRRCRGGCAAVSGGEEAAGGGAEEAEGAIYHDNQFAELDAQN
jgi:hypothetical protein